MVFSSKRLALHLGLAVLLSVVSATHFRFGTIQWQQTPNPTSAKSTGRDVTFTITSAWRKTFFNGGNFNVGATETEGTTFFYPNANSLVAGTVFNMLVNTVNNVSDWFIATQTIYSTYATDGTYIATFGSCCRISTLINNPNGWFRVTAQVLIVNGASFRSIQSQVVPIVNAGQNQQLSFRVGVITYQNEFLGYRLATAVEAAGAGFNYNQINGLTLDFNTGLITWTPTTLGFQSLQVIVMGYTAQPSANAQTVNLQTYVAVDFLIDVVPPTQKQCKRFCSNLGALCFADTDCFNCIENGAPSLRTPYCVLNTPPFFTGLTFNGAALNLVGANNGSATTIDVTAPFGVGLTLTATAADNNTEDFVTVVSSVIPSGALATLTPNANPATLTITWTPQAAQVGTVICFTATDSLQHSTVGLLCVRINLINGVLAASRTGLTYAVAGQQTSVSIQDAPSRTISMTITGAGTTATAVVTPIAGTTSNSGLTSNYTGTYNVAGTSTSLVTQAGFYALQISDVTTGIDAIRPRPLAFSLQVVPAQTSPPQTVIYQQGSSGLSGGVSGSTLSFLLQARDAFGNNQIGQVIDNFTMTTTFTGTVTQFNFQHVGNGVWNVSYLVPVSTTTGTYLISVYYSNTTASNILVNTYTANVLTNSFFISTVPASPLSFAAGSAIAFTIVVPVQSDGSQGLKNFNVTVNGAAATVALTNATSGQPAYYAVTATAVTLASTYFSGVLITAAGLNGNNPGVVNLDLIITPSTASGPNSVLGGSFVDLVAGSPVTLTVQLKDVFGNVVTNGQDVVTYAYSIANSAISLSGNAVFANGLYSFQVSSQMAGVLTLTVSIAPSAANNNVGSAVALSPYTLRVVPAAFSFSQSGASGTYSTTAGTPQLLTLTSFDQFRNERNIDPDVFNTTFTMSLGGNQFISGSSNVVQIPNTGMYSISYQSNTTGSWNLNIAVLKVENQAAGVQTFVSFANVPITVAPGAINPANAKVFGSGLAGGTEGSNALILMQSRDNFNNVVPGASGGLYIVQVVNPSGVSNYYAARYCFPGAASCPLNSSIDITLTQAQAQVAALNTTDQFATLSAEEMLSIGAGFWKINYPVPLRSATAGNNFSISVFYGNLSEFQSGDTAAVILARNSTVRVAGPIQAAASAATTTGTATADNWGVVALGVGSGAVVLSAIGYAGWRLQRYRPKYKQEKARADAAEQMLQDIADEVDVVPGGRDWDAVGAATVTLNPLHPASTMKSEDIKRLQQIHDPQSAMHDTSRGAVRKEFAPKMMGRVEASGSISSEKLGSEYRGAL
eukprot:TRINITY_DN1352_c0_g1_i1.p1 TRINITY_DN1352_c0_g1~~TRINITY_DN1352_c0_g1_i1.p1  ORF type:complete len:1298 (+),score=410.60 TRINITY_DN1352_c0_g1_i1:152-4045(+)